jgi:hypothetical protein
MSQPQNAAVWFGEPAGLIAGIEPASVIVREMAADAASPLAGKANVTCRRSPPLQPNSIVLASANRP